MANPRDDASFQPDARAASAAALDVNWASVDPAALASMEMALAFGTDADGPLAVAAAAAHAEAEACGQVAARDAAAFADEESAAADLERRIAEVGAQLVEAEAAAHAADEDAPGSESDADGDDGSAVESADEDSTRMEADAADGGDEEEGMGAPQGTVEASWGGEDTGEWTLERIVRRRRVRGPIGSFDPDVEAEDMQWEYLCVWQGYAETTWERRAFLQDYGFGDRVEEHDRRAAPAKPTSTKRHRPKKPSGSGEGLTAKQRRQKARAEARLERERLRQEQERLRRLGEEARVALKNFANCVHGITARTEMLGRARSWRTVVDRLLKNGVTSSTVAASPQGHHDVATKQTSEHADIKDRAVARLLHNVSSQLGRCNDYFNNHAVKTITVIDPETLDGLAARIRANPSASVRVVYHGTRAEAVQPIMDKGLVVPRPEINGVRVANGSAYGLGIYTADNVGTPLSYMRGSNTLFVCIGMAGGNASVVKSPGNGFHIFGEDDAVAPVLRLSLKPGYGTTVKEIARYDGTTLAGFNAPPIH